MRDQAMLHVISVFFVREGILVCGLVLLEAMCLGYWLDL
jgi:hypothetical protein